MDDKPKPKRKRSLPWWDWSTPIPFVYELDASLEYVVEIVKSLYRPGYWFQKSLTVDVVPNEAETEYSFQIQALNYNGRTPSIAYAKGRIYKDSRSTVIIEGEAYIDTQRIYRSRLPWLIVCGLFVFISNLVLLFFRELHCMLVPLNLAIFGVISSSDWLSLPHREQQKVLDHINRAAETISKSKTPYYKPPKPVGSPEKGRPGTMQRPQK